MATMTSNRPGAVAKARMIRMSASKARVVLNLIRGKQVAEAQEILDFSERLAADAIAKCLNSAIANAEHNEDLDEDELYVSACFADEGPTLRRFRPRARGRAGRINKQTCHITVEVSRFTDDELEAMRSRAELREQNRSSKASKRSGGSDRARRVAKSKAAAEADDAVEEATDEVDETAVDEVVEQVEETTETVEEAAEATTDEAAAEDDVVAEDDVAEDVTEEDVGDDAGSDEEEK